MVYHAYNLTNSVLVHGQHNIFYSVGRILPAMQVAVLLWYRSSPCPYLYRFVLLLLLLCVVIDPCFGSGTTLRASYELGRSSYGLEIDKNFFEMARDNMLKDYLTMVCN